MTIMQSARQLARDFPYRDRKREYDHEDCTCCVAVYTKI